MYGGCGEAGDDVTLCDQGRNAIGMRHRDQMPVERVG
jgi:hypothetical protein